MVFFHLPMRVSRPISVSLPAHGILFAESAHAADFRMAPRTDPYHKLIYVLSGRVAYRENQRAKAVEARAGTMLIVPRGVAHEITDQQASSLLLLCLSGEFLGLEADLASLWLPLSRLTERRLVLGQPARHQLEAMWRRALVEAQHARLGGSVTVRALAVQTLVLLARLPVTEGGATAAERVSAVIREIKETFYDEWDIDRAAARSGLSRRRFTELFRAATGQTFWDLLNDLRLAHAAKLLRGREHSLLGVIFTCGFNDVSHFYRMFRRRYGAAPGAWLSRGN
jgi:AraC family L-rhamnose operon regulatory protein RhaS